MYEQRLAAVHRVLLLKQPVAHVAREFGVSRKTLYKWLKRHERREPFALHDRSRRPQHSRGKTDDTIELAVVEVRRRYNWGPRKIRRVLLDRPLAGVPSVRTVANILDRRGCLLLKQTSPPAAPPQSFARGAPNELWQVDHKGPIEVARQKVMPLAVIDDHSRYCLSFTAVSDLTMQTAWNVLWDLFGEVGVPESILCDNAFGGAHHTAGLSWFDAQLVRLGIKPVHGRPYHPQTQGKVERFNGTVDRELIDFDARRDSVEHFAADSERYRMTYNTIRPHEALDDLPPIVFWKPSSRVRPATLPQVSYPADAVTRRVSHGGDVRYRNARILLGRGLAGQTVRIEQREREAAVYYSWKLLRVIPLDQLGGPHSDKMV